MEEIAVNRERGRPMRLFELADWAWVYPSVTPFILFVAAEASADDEVEIRRFAVNAVESGCAYICAWGKGCELVHDLFDGASIAADRFVMSTWHTDESLASALYFALMDAWPDDDAFPKSDDAPIVFAVQEPWITDVRSLLADQKALVRLVLDEED